MGTMIFTNKAKRIAELEAQLKEVTTDRDQLVQSVKDFEAKIEQSKQSAAAFSLGSQEWEKEKKALVDNHAKAIDELSQKLTAASTAKETVIKENEAVVAEVKEQAAKDVQVTDEKVNKAAMLKLTAMNLSEGELPAPEEKKGINIDEARKMLASLTGKSQREFYLTHQALFNQYVSNPSGK